MSPVGSMPPLLVAVDMASVFVPWGEEGLVPGPAEVSAVPQTAKGRRRNLTCTVKRLLLVLLLQRGGADVARQWDNQG